MRCTAGNRRAGHREWSDRGSESRRRPRIRLRIRTRNPLRRARSEDFQVSSFPKGRSGTPAGLPDDPHADREERG